MYCFMLLVLHITLPHHLMPYQLFYFEPVIFQVLPCLMLCYESWRSMKPQIFWPPLISVSYCTSFPMALWFSCYVILSISLSFRSGIERVKCVIFSITIFIFLVYSNQEVSFLRGSAKQAKVIPNQFFLGTNSGDH